MSSWLSSTIEFRRVRDDIVFWSDAFRGPQKPTSRDHPGFSTVYRQLLGEGLHTFDGFDRPPPSRIFRFESPANRRRSSVGRIMSRIMTKA